ncbi:26S proteasome non-ATPase regulatory subunit 4-like [Styela clava]
MVLESTVICIDNSEYMRNGDYLPTRIQAQQDAANLVCRTKLRSNPENNVALLSLADVQVHVTLTNDSGKLLSKLLLVQPKGNIRFLNGIRVAHLALKHRQSKNHRMRIIAFVGSPIEDDEKEINKVAKKLKKEKVNVEIVNFGEEELNTPKLTSFIEILNGKDGTGSNIVNIPPGSMLSNALMNSPIIAGEGGAPSSGGGEFDLGFDPASDPELALALRVSLEEQRHRQEEEARAGSEIQETQSAPATAMATGTGEDDMLRAALAMSMNQEVPATAPPGSRPVDISSMSEEEQIAYAMRMSMQEESSQSAMDTDEKTISESPMVAEYGDDGDSNEEDVIADPAFLQSVLQNLPGVDTSSEAIQQAMDQLAQNRQDSDKDKKKDNE